MKDKKLTCIGGGNMAEALIKGVVDSDLLPIECITVTDIREERLAELNAKYGVNVTQSNRDAVAGADIILLAVKPQVMQDVLGGLSDALTPDTLVISIAAGIKAGKIESLLGDAVRVVRVMPNTPALIGQGISAICAGRNATEADLQDAEALIQAVGQVVQVEEKDMDAVTAVSGSGPAYVFYLLDAMMTAANELGLSAEDARALAGNTVEGAAKLFLESGEEADALRQKVQSKGGTTEAAVNVLNQKAVKQAFVEALTAARDRSEELSQ